MPATPAWPPRSTPRLYVETPLEAGRMLRLEGGQAHYLAGVMRMRPGDPVRLFDDASGEWLGIAREVRKRDLTVEVTERLAEREAVPDLWLCAAPIRKGRIDWVAEKACELGAARLVPVLMQRSVVDRLNLDRLRAHMIEAAEQCGRTALPALDEPVKLAALLRDWPADRAHRLERRFASRLVGEIERAGGAKAAILIGPEGGFTDQEREAIRAVPSARAIALGPRILRAETAAAAALAVWMAAAGDW
jgi:16S rRNA (uracil1498-N3)-methyltransferase